MDAFPCSISHVLCVNSCPRCCNGVNIMHDCILRHNSIATPCKRSRWTAVARSSNLAKNLTIQTIGGSVFSNTAYNDFNDLSS